ncbi:recombinase family protein [Kitasatospora purpeofusca]|uniref:recombinase family protein n=1 Tax=Kitasatospora purpeofusca TaxID=67352 RepID=UPI0036EFA037
MSTTLAERTTLATRTVRAVVGARVSDTHGDEGKTSHLTQAESGERFAAARFWEIVGTFEDLDVSAEVSPWKRPDLGPWLTERDDEWDALIWAKVDRAFRSAKDCADVAHWAEQNKKILVFTDDGIVLDFTRGADDMATMMAKVFLMMAAIFAEMELRRIKNRVTGAHRHLRKTDRWAGGQPPYGYRIVDRPGGGRTLEIDPVSSAVVRLMGKLYLEGKSLNHIAEILTAAGHLTPAQYVIQQQGENSRSKRKKPPLSIWNQTSIGKILRSPATMGFKLLGTNAKNRRIARDDKGLPIRIADAIFTAAEWEALQEALKTRTVTKERSNGTAPWLGVAHCDTCAARLYRQVTENKNGKTYEYYRCVKTAGKPKCGPGYSFAAEELNAVIDAVMTFELGRVPLTVRRFIPGEDHTEELETVIRAMEEVREEKDLGAYDYPGGSEEYKERITALAVRRKVLAAMPHRPSEWVEEDTDRTYGDVWAELDTERRRLLLISAGVKVYASPEVMGWYIPKDLAARVQKYGKQVPDAIALGVAEGGVVTTKQWAGSLGREEVGAAA